jgi:subtilisin family serine protease
MDHLPTTARRLVRPFGLTAGAAALVLAFATTPALAAPAQGEIRQSGGATAVPNSYIVVLKDGSAGVAATARSLAGQHNGSVKYTYQSALRGFATTMSESQAKQLALDPAVAYVEQDHVVQADVTQNNPPSWGLDRTDQANLPLSNSYSYATTAENVHAYIIDTGILTTHTTFGGRARIGNDSVGDGRNGVDCNGHGTHVAGTVGGREYGIAKGVQLVAVRVLNCQGSGTTAGVAAGIDWVTANSIKPAVANMSLGGGPSTALDNAVARSIASGVTYAIAAGNGDILGRPANACNFSPARTPTAITVGATQRSDASASFSNFGTCLDIWAPGVGITSSWIGANNTSTNTISGTSMATPHVAGAAARYLANNPRATPQQVRDALVNAATQGKVTNPGTGSPNRLLFAAPTS